VAYNTEIPPLLADRLVSLIPLKIERELMKANLDPLIASESARFDAVEKSGFKVDRKAVLTDLLLLRGGGYYIDVGTSKRIADGDIKVKSGVKIEKFSEKGLVFEDGEEVEADLVVFATGYQRDPRRQAAGIVGDKIAGKLPWYRGLDEEGEIRGDMRPSGK
jgi:flavin-dependent dehydrogenase